MKARGYRWRKNLNNRGLKIADESLTCFALHTKSSHDQFYLKSHRILINTNKCFWNNNKKILKEKKIFNFRLIELILGHLNSSYRVGDPKQEYEQKEYSDKIIV